MAGESSFIKCSTYTSELKLQEKLIHSSATCGGQRSLPGRKHQQWMVDLGGGGQGIIAEVPPSAQPIPSYPSRLISKPHHCSEAVLTLLDNELNFFPCSLYSKKKKKNSPSRTALLILLCLSPWEVRDFLLLVRGTLSPFSLFVCKVISAVPGRAPSTQEVSAEGPADGWLDGSPGRSWKSLMAST